MALAEEGNLFWRGNTVGGFSRPSQPRAPLQRPPPAPRPTPSRRPGADQCSEAAAVRGAEAGPARPRSRRHSARELAVRGADGERRTSQLGGHGWRGNKQPQGARPEAASSSPCGRRRGSGRGYSVASDSPQPRLPEPCGAAPSPPRSPSPSPPFLPGEKSFVCGIFLPTFGTGPGREGTVAGAGGGEGGSYLLLIYLFSSFLPQVAMVIPSSLSLKSRGDGHPFVSSTPSPPLPLPLSHGGGSLPALTAQWGWGRAAPSTWLRLLSAWSRLPSVLPWLPSASPELPSALHSSAQRDPSSPQRSRPPLPSQRRSETRAAKTASSSTPALKFFPVSALPLERRWGGGGRAGRRPWSPLPAGTRCRAPRRGDATAVPAPSRRQRFARGRGAGAPTREASATAAGNEGLRGRPGSPSCPPLGRGSPAASSSFAQPKAAEAARPPVT